MPTSKIVEMLNNDEDVTIKRKIFNIFAGKKEYKVSQIIKKDYQRAREKYSLLIESLFNESVSITDEEYAQKLYDEDFVIEKIESAIANYMCTAPAEMPISEEPVVSRKAKTTDIPASRVRIPERIGKTEITTQMALSAPDCYARTRQAHRAQRRQKSPSAALQVNVEQRGVEFVPGTGSRP